MECKGRGGKQLSPFTLLSRTEIQGYPGNAIVSVTYTLTDEDMLTLTYRVLSDADTPVNLTNHGYFNLLGNNGGSVLDHKARILADFYTPSDETSIPTGEILPVKGNSDGLHGLSCDRGADR